MYSSDNFRSSRVAHDRSVPEFCLLFGSLFAVSMLLLERCWQGLAFCMQRHRGCGWPQTAATIEASSVVAERHFEGKLFFRQVIRYRYAAPGGNYVGDKLATTSRLYPKEATAQRIADRYPLGTTVMARYNPTIRPRQSSNVVLPAASGFCSLACSVGSCRLSPPPGPASPHARSRPSSAAWTDHLPHTAA